MDNVGVGSLTPLGFRVMAYAIDTDGTRAVGSTVLTTGKALRDCSVGIAQAGGQARSAVGGGQPVLGPALAAFVAAHERKVGTLALAYAGLGRNLTWAAISTLDVELANAASLGSRGLPPPPGAPRSRGGS